MQIVFQISTWSSARLLACIKFTNRADTRESTGSKQTRLKSQNGVFESLLAYEGFDSFPEKKNGAKTVPPSAKPSGDYRNQGIITRRCSFSGERLNVTVHYTLSVINRKPVRNHMEHLFRKVEPFRGVTVSLRGSLPRELPESVK
jgi:hypothetical protein